MKLYKDINISEILNSCALSGILAPNHQHLNTSSPRPLVVHHNAMQLTFILNGSGHFYSGDKIYKIDKDALIVIGFAETHSFVADEHGLELFHIHIPETGIEHDRVILHNDVCQLPYFETQ